jgi:L-asparaginase
MTTGDQGGVTPALSAEQLLSAVPGLSDLDVAVDTLDFRRLPGASLSFADLTELAEVIRDRFARGVDGIVVVQGTDTIEETAYLLDLYHHGPQPLVVTGAMRNPTMAGPDGPANLLAAVQTANSDDARNRGATVVLADEIHAAHRVRKTHSTAGSTFQSPNGGPLGYIVEGRPRLLNARTSRIAVPAPTRRPLPRVALIAVTLADDGLLVDALVDQVDGAVIAGFGVGHVPSWLVARLEALAMSVPVVLASRTNAGPVLAGTYGFAGSERDLLGRGLISAGFLDPFKARVLLHALMAAGADHATERSTYAAAGGCLDTTSNNPAAGCGAGDEGARDA